jgi:hypothetical protein
MDALQKPTLVSGRSIRWTPPASASDDSPFQRLWHARWTATRADEHAVSTDRLGPRKSKACEIRLAAMLSEPPGLVYALIAARSCCCRSQ